jgi:hypothetical protein
MGRTITELLLVTKFELHITYYKGDTHGDIFYKYITSPLENLALK